MAATLASPRAVQLAFAEGVSPIAISEELKSGSLFEPVNAGGGFLREPPLIVDLIPPIKATN